MNAIDSHQKFKCEYIVGVSLSNDLHRLNQINYRKINSNVDTNKERQVFYKKFNNKQNQIYSVPVNEQSGKQQLKIIGSECGPKTSNHQNVYSSIGPKFKLSRIDQTMLQLPKRTTFITNRKVQENVYPRTWTSHVPRVSDQTTPDKLAIVCSNRRANTSTQNSDNKSNMVQRTQANPVLSSSITILKKLSTTNNQISPRLFKKPQQHITTLGRDTTLLKLPSLFKKTPSSIFKSIPSAYIQDSSRLQVPSSTNINRSVLQPTPILPIYTPHRAVVLFTEQHFPLIKDRIIKANLAQKASFKCKSPSLYRSESSLSRSTNTLVKSSQIQTKTNNPFKHMVPSSLLNEVDRSKLKRLFQQLDTDRDGHLTYSQVQICLPSNLPRAQETFFHTLYDIISDITYFGLQEFYTTAVLVNMIGEQDSHIWNTLLDDVDFNYYRDDILELLDEFDTRYSPVISTINFDNLVALIMNRTTNDKYERITKELENLIPTIKTMKFIRLEFIAIIPIIIYIESCLDHGKALFRFRDNSILDLHIQKALLT